MSTNVVKRDHALNVGIFSSAWNQVQDGNSRFQIKQYVRLYTLFPHTINDWNNLTQETDISVSVPSADACLQSRLPWRHATDPFQKGGRGEGGGQTVNVSWIILLISEIDLDQFLAHKNFCKKAKSFD